MLAVGFRRCPWCAEQIPAEAIRCRYCETGLPVHLDPRWSVSGLELIILGAVVVIVGTITIPLHYKSKRVENERRATATLRNLGEAERDFRENDRDRNGVNEFWTGDVSGLYFTRDARLIAPEEAFADSHPMPDHSFQGKSHCGYRFRALVSDLQEEVPYQTDTDGSGRCVHHPSKFGFAAVPDSDDLRVWIINEWGSLFKRYYRNGDVFEPHWPPDEIRCEEWGRS